MNVLILKILIELSQDLRVKPPQCVFDGRRREGEPLCELRLSGYELVFRTDEPKKLLAYQMAYSLRRLHQYLYNPSILRGYRYKGEIDSEDFNNQPAEIDAHAYACCFCISRFNTYISDECFSETTTKMIKKRCKEIWKGDPDFYREYKRLYIDEHIKAANIIESTKEYMKTHRKRWRKYPFDPRYEYMWYKPGSYKEVMDSAIRKTREEAQTPPGEMKSFRELLVETTKVFDDIKSIYGELNLPEMRSANPETDYFKYLFDVRRRKPEDIYNDYDCYKYLEDDDF